MIHWRVEAQQPVCMVIWRGKFCELSWSLLTSPIKYWSRLSDMVAWRDIKCTQ